MLKLLRATTLFALLGLVSGISCTPSSSAAPSQPAAIPPPAIIQQLPDFTAFNDIKQKKLAFFELLGPIVDWENHIIKQKRERLLAILKAKAEGKKLKPRDLAWLDQLAKDYRVSAFKIDDSRMVAELKSRVDIVPRELALAQAANESGWGTSRFARQANNLFGQWCFTKGCGLVPRRRSAGATHEVAKFPSVNAAVRGYLSNLNTGSAYRALRMQRAALRSQNITPNATQLATGLLKYSERGVEYVADIQSLIRFNQSLMDATLQ